MGQSINEARVSVFALRCERLDNPLGIDALRPRLAWKLAADHHNVLQTAYQIQVFRAGAPADPIWDSGKVLSDTSIGVDYAGPALESRQRYAWHVRIWDERDAVSDWSSRAWWEMGLLQQVDWQAQWIEPHQKPATREPVVNIFQNLGMISPAPESDGARLNPSQYLRKVFASRGPVARARLYATAHGIYQLEINGRRVGDQELAPEATAYHQYLQYQTYDVTGLIGPGNNVVGAVLGDGWYCGRIGLPGDSCQYGDKLALLLQLEIEYQDGSRQWVLSDEAFKSATGPLIYSDLFIGERYDARREHAGWHTPEFDELAWQPVTVANYGYGNLVAQYGEPLRVVVELAPRDILITPTGETVVDFGQNISGKIRMRVHGAAGTKVVLDYSETLDAAGNFRQQIRGRNKDQRDFYILKGDGVEEYTPWFTTHGFRYVRVTGYPGAPSPDAFVGLVIASDLLETGSFTCSDPRLNRLQENIRWSQRGNLVSIPTDCPQRERAGFTGDAQVFAPTACFNMDVNAFFTRWLRNLQLEQRADGQVPVIVPYWQSYIDMFTPVQGGAHTSAGWGDACIIVPWTLYQAYGDLGVLAENYPTMVRWLDYVQQEAETGIPERLQAQMTPHLRARQRYLWNTGFHFGDWLIPSLTAGGHSPLEAANATKEITASCFYAYSTELLAHIAGLLGHEEAQQRYVAQYANICAAFADEYMDDEGRLSSHYQGMYVLALKMGMVPEEKQALVTGQLVSLIAENDFRLDTGFVSVPYLLDVLCDNGREDVAYKLLFQTECPSWLYEVDRGATTIWESWDAIAPDGQVSLASLNHYAFGCVGDWMVRTVTGLDKGRPGYKHIVIRPRPHRGLTQAAARYQSVYGEIVSAWKWEAGRLRVQATIPPNTTATIRLPGADSQAIHAHSAVTQDGPDVCVEVGSGCYRFDYLYPGLSSAELPSAEPPSAGQPRAGVSN